MRWFRTFLLFVFVAVGYNGMACTIVAVSGRVTQDGRPLLMKNRDSGSSDIRICIGNGLYYQYLCQSYVTDVMAYSGYNECGFSIVSSHSYNMPNSDSDLNPWIMKQALGRCATLDEFENYLNSLPKPIAVCSNYGVMDSAGNIAIFEVNAYSYVRYNVDSNSSGCLVRTNFSFSQDTTAINTQTPTSLSRYLIASNYLDGVIQNNGYIAKEDLFGLSRCLVNSNGDDLRDIAPFDENVSMPIDFRYYIPRYMSTSAMIIQGILTGEAPAFTVAWTMVGPPMATATIPLLMTADQCLPQKAILGEDGHAWLSYQGQLLKNRMFINNNTIDLAKLYNYSTTGIMQKIGRIEEDILLLGEELLEGMRRNGFSDDDVATYYAWVDNYLEDQYSQCFYNGAPTNAINGAIDETREQETEYYDLLGRRLRNAPDDAVIKRTGNKAIILK